MELSTKQVGNLTELQCLTALCELGYNVSIPYGDSARYDIIADICGKLIRIQVKTSSLKNADDENVIHFSCRSTHTTSQGVNNVRYSEDEIDYFATYWKNKCYLIPISECSTTKTLRLALPKNNQTKGISFAWDYELEKQIDKIKGGSN